MLDLELTPSARALNHRRRRATAETLALEHDELFLLMATLGGASGVSLRPLYFDRAPRSSSRRAAFRRLSALVEHGLLVRQSLPDSRVIYHLGSAALSLVPRLRARVSDSHRKRIPDTEAGHDWLRSTLWAALVDAGYNVGRGQAEHVALRRFLIDRQVQAAKRGGADAERVLAALRSDTSLTPLFRSRCRRCAWMGALGEAVAACAKCRAPVEQALSERKLQCARCGFVSDERFDAAAHQTRGTGRCSQPLREVDHLAFDVAWRGAGVDREVLLVLVDDPSISLDVQLRRLPLRTVGQPRLPIVLRTTDPHSIFDRPRGTWTAMGDRHRALLRAFSDGGARNTFPFSLTADVVEFAPGLQLRLAPHRR